MTEEPQGHKSIVGRADTTEYLLFITFMAGVKMANQFAMPGESQERGAWLPKVKAGLDNNAEDLTGSRRLSQF